MNKLSQLKFVECLSCHQMVIIRLMIFGTGFVGICPRCTHLAYNSKREPPDFSQIDKLLI